MTSFTDVAVMAAATARSVAAEVPTDVPEENWQW